MKNSNIFILAILFIIITSCSNSIVINNNHKLLTDTTFIKSHLDSIVNTPEFRNYENISSLNQVAEYIRNQFLLYSNSVSEQKFQYNGEEYKNIICTINPEKKDRIVIGAHYDVCGDQDGADDNASGVAGLLELARLLKNANLNYRVDLVAYTLEEPPAYATKYMGSYIHAKSLADSNISIKGMISLEMIGYFDESENSQSYPVGLLKHKYGTKGDYIVIVQKYWDGDFGNEIFEKMEKQKLIPTKSFKGFKFVTGVDFSDHRNYWEFDYSAIMITNTSFYRNHNYHRSTDKIPTLDIKRMALVIDELYLALKELDISEID